MSMPPPMPTSPAILLHLHAPRDRQSATLTPSNMLQHLLDRPREQGAGGSNPLTPTTTIVRRPPRKSARRAVLSQAEPKCIEMHDEAPRWREVPSWWA